MERGRRLVPGGGAGNAQLTAVIASILLVSGDRDQSSSRSAPTLGLAGGLPSVAHEHDLRRPPGLGPSDGSAEHVCCGELRRGGGEVEPCCEKPAKRPGRLVVHEVGDERRGTDRETDREEVEATPDG